MATMPGQNEQPKPSAPNEQRDPKHSRPTETTKQTMPGSPVQPGQQYETPEPKRREPEKPADAKRAPEHEPGYEAKHQKEAGKQDDANRRSQADDSKAKIEADDDKHALHTQKANRASASKQHVKRAHPAKSKAKAKVRKHK